jgi:hypothetical protein
VDTKTFFTRVLSPTDEVVICTHKPDPTGSNPKGFFWDNGSFADLDDAVAAVQRFDKQADMTVYYSVGKFANHQYISEKTGKPRHHRYKHLATSFKALAFDLDCGADKPYATQKEGWAALKAGLLAIGFPMPMVVSSGNGIHCYWPLTSSVKAEHWEKASIALRLALDEHKVQIDVSKIHDTSMVLRPVGSHHKKQTPWKEVRCVADCPDYDPAMLFGLLKPWFGKIAASVTRPIRAGGTKGRSSVMSALLDTGDIVLDAVVQGCAQLAAIVASGGVSDAAGRPVTEPMWRATIGFAKYCTDVDGAVVAMAGKHPDFDLADSKAKMINWKATGPTTCVEFEKHCSSGCAGCPRKGTITSPAGLNKVIDIVPPPGVAAISLPGDYFMDGGKIWMDVEKEISSMAADGKKLKAMVTEKTLVCPLEMYITGIFTDYSYSSTTATLHVKYPLGNWKEHELPLGKLSSPKDLSDYLINKQIFITQQAVQERTRIYLMNYLEMVQKQAPSGADFVSFGWQDDGSFLCGETLINSPTGNVARRLKGPASRYADIICLKGDREVWADATAMLDIPQANNVAAAILLSGVGILGPVAGNATAVISFFSTKTTTGKTTCLYAANSTFGHPKALLMRSKDTSNATYKMRGVLNNMPGTVDELTMLPPEQATEMAYSFSEGREKIAMTKDRELREPAVWAGPTMVSCNISLISKYSEVMAQSDPVRIRTLEFVQDDNHFAKLAVRGAHDFFDAIEHNHGFFIPEVVEAIVTMGGARKVWEDGAAAFDKKFSFAFETEERFYKTNVVAAWIVGLIGKKLGIVRFDVTRVIQHMLDRIVALRAHAVASASDAFDTIGQFLQEHADMLLVASEEYIQGGKGKEVPQYPLPMKAVARMTLVFDAQNPVLPGSRMAINTVILKRWLTRSKDSLDRITEELGAAGALVSVNQRVTIYKGCHGQNPAQAWCLVLNMNHPRFAQAITGAKSYQPSPVALSMVAGATT